ncbi:MFS general substrate transporter [Diplogelasinospora grovesii]|uniref:MFS general substrate transporter n=1 Tax=Diplogelasinospora grovesii TaxID=303347 RepID=A0AAN6S8R5_9PEZI|nr:MFS general substrate transporter [Diplogelasinospora grovesii]
MALFRLSSFSWIALLVLLYEIEEQIQFPSTIRLLENSVCQRHYASIPGFSGVIPVDESLCKIGTIQHHLASVRGWYSVSSTLPMLVLGPSYGRLADGVGRRPILGIVTIGMILGLAWIYTVCACWASFPTEWVWLIVLPRLIGGGPFMAITLHATMAADLCNDDTRSQTLYRLFCFKLAVELALPQLASILLQHSLWLPYMLCGLALLATLPIIKALPETLSRTAEPVDWKRIGKPLDLAVFHRYKDLVASSKGVWLGLIVTFIVQMRYNVVQILPPYVSVRFGWSISETAKLLSIIPGVSLVIYLVLPHLTDALHARHFSIAWVNLRVLCLSCLALLVGVAIISILPGIVWLMVGIIIFSAGFNVRAPMLAVLAFYIDTGKDTAQLYTFMSVTEALAHVVGSPVLEAIWGAAVELGPPWLILQYLVVDVSS